MKTPGTIAAVLLAALLCAAPRLAADTALRQDFERRVMAQAAALTCAAQVWAPVLQRMAPGWHVVDGPVALPAPGAWAGLRVPLELAGTTETTQVQARVILRACVAGWSPRTALAVGEPLNLLTLQPGLFDPRNLAGPPLTGALPVGATASRGLLPGQALLKTDVNDPTAARAGQRITLMVREGCIVAGDEGVLLDGGGQGSVLRAQHLRSGKIVRGVLDGRTLLVED